MGVVFRIYYGGMGGKEGQGLEWGGLDEVGCIWLGLEGRYMNSLARVICDVAN